MHAKNVTWQPMDVWCQVKDPSALQDNLERGPCSRGDHYHAATCYGGRAQLAPVAAVICG